MSRYPTVSGTHEKNVTFEDFNISFEGFSPFEYSAKPEYPGLTSGGFQSNPDVSTFPHEDRKNDADEDEDEDEDADEDAKEEPEIIPPSGPAAPPHPDSHIMIDMEEDDLAVHTPRQYKPITRALVKGNLVIDVPVPSQVSAYCGDTEETEFTHMRYSAATCDPDDFMASNFILRQNWETRRKTELFIAITMYNEGQDLLYASLRAGKVVVCIVSDGRNKADQSSLSAIAAMGVYQNDCPVTSVGGKPVIAHVFEYSTKVPVSTISPTTTRDEDKGVPPIQMIFCLKENNQKKINSHRWVFNAFCPLLEPTVCVLIDVGTMPGPTSIYHLWRAFDINPSVAGACGEIVALKGDYGENLVNPLVAAQNFEYKMSNILDKPLESVLGYITVLPGAFSAYRYVALLNDELGEGPLQKYFMGELKQGESTDIFTANMYLAEDRVLCWELVSKRNSAWILHYVKSAYAETDLSEFIPQRRRWLNGSFFAAIHSIVHFSYIYRSSHSFARKFWIHVEMAYQLYNLIFAWFALGNYYIAFVVLSTSLEFLSSGIRSVNVILNYVYIGLIIMSFLLSLGNKPQASVWAYTITVIGFAVLMVYMTAASTIVAMKGLKDVDGEKVPLVVKIFSNSVARDIAISLFSTLGLYIISSLIALDPWHMLTSFTQYLLMSPSYVAVLNVYAFANIHDISWGTKTDVPPSQGSNPARLVKGGQHVRLNIPSLKEEIDKGYEEALEDLKKDKPLVADPKPDPTHSEDFFRAIRTNVLLAWVVSNALLASIVSSSIPTVRSVELGDVKSSSGYFTFILYSIAGLSLVRFIGSTTYMFVWLFGSATLEFVASVRA
ncbi:glycosyltransferase family 2 protein [Hygrophoropsis aurantiaca]|uniref:Glycosyltransferase family 2 protein n=1 Tax=Hygrophoropsis aurantiaca TaxID=72124 RepID=A0ACB8AR48_9AGAM|nr:glycosyltransferase family 2 protein [Hygrophoropsis aurantiaca]